MYVYPKHREPAFNRGLPQRFSNDDSAGNLQGPAVIMQFFHAAQSTAVMSAAIELNVFAAIASGASTSEEVAARISAPARSVRILLDALCVLGLCSRDTARYRLTSLSEDHLVPGRPMYMGDLQRSLAGDLVWKGMGQLAKAVRADGTVMEDHAETPNNPFWELYAQSTAASAVPAAALLEAHLASWIGKKAKVRILDIAAGSGIYGHTFLRKHSNVEVVALDWPNVLVETKKWGERFKIDRTRFSTIEGSLFEQEFRGPYDLILCSQIFHFYDDAACLTLAKKVGAAMAPDGRVAVQDVIRDDSKLNPAAAMFALTALVWAKKGDAHSLMDYTRWLTESGFEIPSVLPTGDLPTNWLVANKR